MPLSRSNSCVDIDFTLRKKFKKAAFRFELHFKYRLSILIPPTGLFNVMLSSKLLKGRIFLYKQQPALGKAYASNCRQS